jgi:hypothetical protein
MSIESSKKRTHEPSLLRNSNDLSPILADPQSGLPPTPLLDAGQMFTMMLTGPPLKSYTEGGKYYQDKLVRLSALCHPDTRRACIDEAKMLIYGEAWPPVLQVFLYTTISELSEEWYECSWSARQAHDQLNIIKQECNQKQIVLPHLWQSYIQARTSRVNAVKLRRVDKFPDGVSPADSSVPIIIETWASADREHFSQRYADRETAARNEVAREKAAQEEERCVDQAENEDPVLRSMLDGTYQPPEESIDEEKRKKAKSLWTTADMLPKNYQDFGPETTSGISEASKCDPTDPVHNITFDPVIQGQFDDGTIACLRGDGPATIAGGASGSHNPSVDAPRKDSALSQSQGQSLQDFIAWLDGPTELASTPTPGY